MIRTLLARLRRIRDEDGQALVLFAAGLAGMMGLVGLSVDVGRAYWARTQIQGAVDASALAAAQDMPIGTSQATAQANSYWTKNSGFIQSQGENVTFNVSFPTGNRAVKIDASADIPTWFGRFVGFDNWHVAASGTAASSVLDISLVLDISGSMCWGSYPPADKGSAVGPFGPYVGPGKTADQVTVATQVPAGGATTGVSIKVNSSAIFNSSSTDPKFGYSWGSSTKYFTYTPSNGRAGLIRIDDEIMVITSIPDSTHIVVSRGQPDTFLGIANTTKAQHNVGAVIESQHADCILSAPADSGPYDYYDGMITDAKQFTTFFNSTYDRIGLASFSSSATLRKNLTSTYSDLTSSMDAINNPAGGTNSAHGIAVGRQILDGTGKRDNAVRVLVFLTDGRANSYCGSTYNASNYNSTSCPSSGGGNDGNSSAVNAAMAEAARAAADKNIIIYTIGFGPYVDDTFLTNIANTGHGTYYKAPTLAELQAAFESVAQSTHIQLTQ